MTVAVSFKKFLDGAVKAEAASGILTDQLLRVFGFHLSQSNSELRLLPNLVIPLLEMYLETKGWPYAIERKRGFTLIRGIDFKSEKFHQLSNVLDRGLLNSTEVVEKAESLYTGLMGS